MKDPTARNLIAIMLVFTFLGLISFVTIFPYVGELKGIEGTDDIMMKYLEKTSALFTGIIGVVIGYYFGSKPKN